MLYLTSIGINWTLRTSGGAPQKHPKTPQNFSCFSSFSSLNSSYMPCGSQAWEKIPHTRKPCLNPILWQVKGVSLFFCPREREREDYLLWTLELLAMVLLLRRDATMACACVATITVLGGFDAAIAIDGYGDGYTWALMSHCSVVMVLGGRAWCLLCWFHGSLGVGGDAFAILAQPSMWGSGTEGPPFQKEEGPVPPKGFLKGNNQDLGTVSHPQKNPRNHYSPKNIHTKKKP